MNLYCRILTAVFEERWEVPVHPKYGQMPYLLLHGQPEPTKIFP
jgi:hypothetical protein